MFFAIQAIFLYFAYNINLKNRAYEAIGTNIL